ncbi:hypothetical protein TWF696_003361 [Orbilia brochopaga]|uniref:Carboxylic ester hydrolase n=1 Tax=Orbilia brochopaga TaxID=3140254 RepID=A0AAV9TXR2_9PEZI
MAKILRALGIAVLVAVKVAVGAPGPSSLGTSITILKDNDLYGKFSNRTSSALLLEQPITFNAAKTLCASFSENLWSPEIQDFTAGVNNSLSYQAYLRKFSYSQQFWVADHIDSSTQTKTTCRAIDLAGKARVLGCDRLLPALCAHSAPLSNGTFWDTSERYQVTAKNGENSLTGFRDSFGFRFIGVRYAEDPGRFAYSTPYTAVSDENALEYGSWCLQMHDGNSIGEEDCFFLNIATPYLPGPNALTKNLKPVLFWIHGGSFGENSGDLGHTDGVNIASRGDYVVVKINYRVGYFGWLAVDGTSLTGNYGLTDTISALKWVRRNIAAFGGDAGRITVGGDSSGAAAVRALMTSEAADGLFNGGIMESLPIGYQPVKFYSEYLTIPESTYLYGPAVLGGTGCGAVADIAGCLTNIDSAILNPITVEGVGREFFPVVDNIFLKTRNLPVTGKGYAASVPLLIGTNRDETGIQLSPFYGITSFPEFLIGVSQVIGQDVTQFANDPAFPVPSGDPARSAFNVTQRLLTDAGYKCLSWANAYSAVKHKVLPEVYAYRFNRTYQPTTYTNPLCLPPVTPDHPYGDPDAEYFKCHSGEVGTVFGELVSGGSMLRDEYDVPFEQLIVDYWSAFIWNADPNPKPGYLKARGYWGTLNQIAAAGKWERVNTRHPSMMGLQWNGGMLGFDEGPQCDALGLPLDYYETAL